MSYRAATRLRKNCLRLFMFCGTIAELEFPLAPFAGIPKNERTAIAGRIEPAGLVTAAQSIGQFVRDELERLWERRMVPKDRNDLKDCALNALTEQRFRCALALMQACGELTESGHPEVLVRAEQIREDLKHVLRVAKTEIEDHRKLMTLLLGPTVGSDFYSGWCEKILSRLPDEIVEYESTKQRCPLEYRRAIVRELSQLCVRMMQDYCRLEDAIVNAESRISFDPSPPMIPEV